METIDKSLSYYKTNNYIIWIQIMKITFKNMRIILRLIKINSSLLNKDSFKAIRIKIQISKYKKLNNNLKISSFK
jgi:hypothetical protein